jgi:hypothetical protein
MTPNPNHAQSVESPSIRVRATRRRILTAQTGPDHAQSVESRSTHARATSRWILTAQTGPGNPSAPNRGYPHVCLLSGGNAESLGYGNL